jgi:NAD(P)-dependent dehydrogenase (short-subunit alcohol dehydrogenase family)
MGELEGKIAVVTGAGSGMGRATTEVFVREGARVLAADISGREEETAAALGDAVAPCRVDVADEASVEAMFAAALAAFGRVDLVCNVAGIGDAAPLADITLESYERVMGVNLRGVMLGTKHAVRTMLPTGGGVILNWSSTGGMNGSRLPTSVYSATKAGVISFTRAAAIEYGTQGIRANAICPGFIETEMSGGKGAAERFPGLVKGSALRRGGQPEEVAELASFLASDRAPYITGAVIAIDGGSTCMLPS